MKFGKYFGKNIGPMHIIALVVALIVVAYIFRDPLGCLGDCTYRVQGKYVTAEEYLKKGGKPSNCLYGCHPQI